MKILYLLIATLKFLGIAILALLLLLLFLVVIIMIIPVKYNIYINKSESIYALTNFKWLYSIVSLDIIYSSDNKLQNKFKLFGRRIDPKKLIKFTNIFVKKTEKTGIAEAEEPKEIKEINKIEKIKKIEESSNKQSFKKKSNKHKTALSQMQLFEYKKELLTDTLGLVKSIINNIRPSSVHAEVEIGKADPADTGHLMAVISALYPLYYTFANIVGNYEKECFYAKIEASGKISAGKFVYDFIKYIRIKSVRELMKFTRKNRKGK